MVKTWFQYYKDVFVLNLMFAWRYYLLISARKNASFVLAMKINVPKQANGVALGAHNSVAQAATEAGEVEAHLVLK